jgi:hypothetical protein
MTRAGLCTPHLWHANGKSVRVLVCKTSSTTMTTRATPERRTPARGGIHEEARQTLTTLRGCRQTINVVLVALSDGVELEVWADGCLRRRSRFLRDSEARKFSERLATRLSRKGYQRGTPRVRAAQPESR